MNNDNQQDSFLRWFREQLEKSGLPAGEIAKRAGVSKSYVSMLKNGAKSNPTSETISRLIDAIDAGSPCYLRQRSDENPQQTRADQLLELSLARISESEFRVSFRSDADETSLDRTIGVGDTLQVSLPGSGKRLLCEIDMETMELKIAIPLGQRETE